MCIHKQHVFNVYIVEYICTVPKISFYDIGIINHVFYFFLFEYLKRNVQFHPPACSPWNHGSPLPPILGDRGLGALIISAKLLAKENLESQVGTHLLQGHDMTSWLMWTHIPGPCWRFSRESLSRMRCVFCIKIRQNSKINNSNCQDIFGWEELLIPPWKLIYPLKIDGWKMKFLSTWSFFRGHVNSGGVSDVFAYLNWSHYTPISYFAARESTTNYQPLHSNSPRDNNPTL